MKKKKWIYLIFMLITVTFICSYVVSQSGYYEYNLQSKKNLTEKEIKQFENDIKEGKDVDITDYMKDKTVDYSNTLTRTTVKVSTTINKYLKKTIESVFKILNIFSLVSGI